MREYLDALIDVLHILFMVVMVIVVAALIMCGIALPFIASPWFLLLELPVPFIIALLNYLSDEWWW